MSCKLETEKKWWARGPEEADEKKSMGKLRWTLQLKPLLPSARDGSG
jgi:hypothetical protein